jgi:hypothetical protein
MPLTAVFASALFAQGGRPVRNISRHVDRVAMNRIDPTIRAQRQIVSSMPHATLGCVQYLRFAELVATIRCAQLVERLGIVGIDVQAAMSKQQTAALLQGVVDRLDLNRPRGLVRQHHPQQSAVLAGNHQSSARIKRHADPGTFVVRRQPQLLDRKPILDSKAGDIAAGPRAGGLLPLRVIVERADLNVVRHRAPRIHGHASQTCGRHPGIGGEFRLQPSVRWHRTGLPGGVRRYGEHAISRVHEIQMSKHG